MKSSPECLNILIYWSKYWVDRLSRTIRRKVWTGIFYQQIYRLCHYILHQVVPIGCSAPSGKQHEPLTVVWGITYLIFNWNIPRANEISQGQMNQKAFRQYRVFISDKKYWKLDCNWQQGLHRDQWVKWADTGKKNDQQSSYNWHFGRWTLSFMCAHAFYTHNYVWCYVVTQTYKSMTCAWLWVSPDICQSAIMEVANVLASKKHRVISKHHSDSTVTIVCPDSYYKCPSRYSNIMKRTDRPTSSWWLQVCIWCQVIRNHPSYSIGL